MILGKESERIPRQRNPSPPAPLHSPGNTSSGLRPPSPHPMRRREAAGRGWRRTPVLAGRRGCWGVMFRIPSCGFWIRAGKCCGSSKWPLARRSRKGEKVSVNGIVTFHGTVGIERRDLRRGTCGPCRILRPVRKMCQYHWLTSFRSPSQPHERGIYAASPAACPPDGLFHQKPLVLWSDLKAARQGNLTDPHGARDRPLAATHLLRGRPRNHPDFRDCA